MVRRLAWLGLCLAGCVGLILGNEYELGRRGLRPLTQPELEATLRDLFHLSTVALREDAPGHYVGAGTGTTGRSYEFDVAEGPAERHIVADWRTANPPAAGTADVTTRYSSRWLVPAVVGIIFLGIAAATLKPVMVTKRDVRTVAS